MISPFIENMFTRFDLSAGAKELLFENAEQMELKNNERLLTTGEICRAIWLVKSGCLKLANNKDGKDITLNIGLAGDFITDLHSLRLNKGSENYIQSCGSSSVIVLNKTKLQDLYKTSSEIMDFGRRILEQLLSEQEEHANLFKLYTPLERYHLILSKRPLLFQMVTLTDLASYLGMSRETLTRIRRAR